MSKRNQHMGSPPKRAGDFWNLWRVDRAGRPIGFLITGGTGKRRNSRLVAFVKGVDQESFSLALAIRRDNSRARYAMDLRGKEWHRAPKIIKAKLLWPLDSLGRVNRGDSTFAAACYLPSAFGSKGALALLSHFAASDLDRNRGIGPIRNPIKAKSFCEAIASFSHNSPEIWRDIALQETKTKYPSANGVIRG